jgi:hypothetical protein
MVNFIEAVTGVWARSSPTLNCSAKPAKLNFGDPPDDTIRTGVNRAGPRDRIRRHRNFDVARLGYLRNRNVWCGFGDTQRVTKWSADPRFGRLEERRTRR